MAADEFRCWLNDKLRELNTDENIFGSYIYGILEGEDSPEEKIEAIEGILSEILGENLSIVTNNIMEKWDTCHPKIENEKDGAKHLDVETQLAKLLENQKLQKIVQRQYTEEELKIREQILAQYSQTEVSEEEEEENNEIAQESGLVKNTNAYDVQQANKERREQAKMDSQKKKDKDKEDREKQKQLKEEKKEKRKTVKGERRR